MENTDERFEARPRLGSGWPLENMLWELEPPSWGDISQKVFLFMATFLYGNAFYKRFKLKKLTIQKANRFIKNIRENQRSKNFSH